MKIIVFSYCCIANTLVYAQNPESRTDTKESQTEKVLRHQLSQEQSINNKVLELSLASNSMCLLQAYSFHWFFIRIISYQDASYQPCKSDQYLRLSPNSVLAQMRTLPNAPYYVNLPGIHFTTMDVAKSGLGLDYIYIGTIRFFPVAISEISIFDIIRNPGRYIGAAYGRSYTPVDTRENIYFRWNPGSTIVYLRSPKGEVFVMTSYTSALVPSLDRSNLSQLGQFMNLPAGWTFNSKILPKVLEIHSKQAQGLKTRRLVDEYENIYIEVEPKNLGTD